jgi:hypothetical protein
MRSVPAESSDTRERIDKPPPAAGAAGTSTSLTVPFRKLCTICCMSIVVN